MDEDAMFKALLKNKPQQQKKQALVKEDIKETVPATNPVDIHKNGEKMQDIHAVQAAGTYENKELIMQAELIEGSIKNLIISVDRVHNLLRTLIAPVLVLILIVGIAVLILLGSQIMF
ncbi:hypothetical protein ANME2D_02603 [Candidatus Methanoperedens nitroreducens]|uniref:Uncharacterized protein n=1 Tax=Candidatus Methanoperedens nitratireducens TaxID=1392998 RepID=A0A062UZJ0_9EURY|nr:hypothetical protein [Candidatus Methanoperedens nitroreducens]KCZ70582.1 hypothetical protein ANME2D_02603 [Candidatus Methanoperedens nitroreducens]MDJ1420436.1 hypothetical protein [Candidatus Methanoperedens sp.]